MLKAIIFDMDGVLVNTEALHYKVNKTLLKEFGCRLEWDYYKQFIGSTNKYMWPEIRKHYNIPVSAEELEKRAADIKDKYILANGFPHIDGVEAMIKRLYNSKLKLAVASSSPIDYIKRAMEETGLYRYFDILVSSESVERPKPFPDVFIKAADLLQVSPRECVVVEDSENGVKAAKAAGMAVTGYINPDSGNQNLSGADFLIESYNGVDRKFMELVFCRANDKPWVIAETDRLIIREIEINDLEDLYTIYDDDAVRQYVPPMNDDRDYEQRLLCAYIDKIYKFYNYGYWAIIEKSTGQLIGKAGLSNSVSDNEILEIGYIIRKDKRRQGYAYEACREIVKFAIQELQTQPVCYTYRDNIASVNLAEKLGIEVKYID
ncbi:MAG: GNAT family N-acetyltransferase [Eubacterium sp.]